MSQARIPGTETKGEKRVRELAERLDAKRQSRMKLATEESELQDDLVAAMQDEKIHRHPVGNGREVVLIPGKTKVSFRQSKDEGGE